MAPLDFSNINSLAEASEDEIRATVEAQNEEAGPESTDAPVAAGPVAGEAGSGEGQVDAGSSHAAPDASEPAPTPEELRREINGLRAALIEERGGRKDWKAKAAYLEGQLAERQAREAAAQAAAKEEEILDPFERQRQETQRLEQKFDQWTQQQQWHAHQQQQQQFVAAATHAIKSQVDQFKAQVPDYDAAMKHVASIKIAEYRAAGVPEPEQKYFNDLALSAMETVREGKNVGEAAYNYAKLLGYRPQAPVVAAGGQRAQKQSISLSQVPSSSPSNTSPQGVFDPVRMARENPEELARLNRPENSHELERLFREREVGL